MKLCENSNVVIKGNGIAYEDFDKFQNYLSPEYQIIVVTPPKSFYYVGTMASNKQLYLFLSDNHCDSLLSIKAFLRCEYFCKVCLKGYAKTGKHKCDGICQYCFINSGKCKEEEMLIDCDECKRSFANQTCFDNHKSVTKVCPRIWKCQNCNNTLNTKTHFCERTKCRICKAIVPISGHLCYITPNDTNKLKLDDEKPKIFIFYDFESQKIKDKESQFLHRPNICVVNIVCDKCWSSEGKDRKKLWCDFCGNKEYIFRGINAVNDFSLFLFDSYTKFVQHKKDFLQLKDSISVYLIAHNSRVHDCQLILKYCTKNRILKKVLKFYQ